MSDDAGMFRSGREGQFAVLVRSFLNGLFESDLLPDSVDIRQSLVWMAVMFVTPAMWFSLLPAMSGAFDHHPGVWARGRELGLTAQLQAQIEVATWGFELLFLLYSMTVVGFVTVLVWDRVFPDRRDAMVLGTLPIPSRTVLVAKVSALAILIGGFALAINVPSALGMSLAIGDTGRSVGWRYLVAHLTVMPIAGLFVSCCLIGLQTVLAATGNRRLLQALSVLLQLVCVVALLEILVFSPALAVRLAGNALRLSESAVGAWLPPFWFLGLYETIVGTGHRAYHDLAITATLAVSGSLLVVFTTYLASYRRIVRQAIESVEPRRRGSTPLTRLGRWLTRLAVRHPTEQVIVGFILKTLARSQFHQLVLAVYVGVALAFIIGGALFLLATGGELSLATPTTLTLSAPLVLSFFTLVGLRLLFNLPSELEAHCVFRLTEADAKTVYLRAARKTLWLALTPIVVVTLPGYWLLWGAGPALGHTVLWLLLAAALTEVLLIGFHKVPFTCAYVPGRANFKWLFPLYLAALNVYAYSTSRLEQVLLSDPVRWTAACGALLVGLVVVVRARDRARSVAIPLTFHDEADHAVELRLSHPG